MNPLESALNDLAVIDTTFETLDLFPEDEELRQELWSIIDEARGNLVQSLLDTLSGLESGANSLSERQQQRFKDSLLRLATLGADRQGLDRFLFAKFFVPFSEEEAQQTGTSVDPLFRYRFRHDSDLPRLRSLPSHRFLHAVFQDLVEEATDDANYEKRFRFGARVQQKYLAIYVRLYFLAEPISDHPELDQ